jgi:hypothetical protein
VVERYIQLKGCLHVDEIVPYATEQDLEDILRSFKLDVHLWEMSTGKRFLGRTYCEEKGLNCILMDGITVFQAVVCVKVANKKTIRVY